MRRFVLILFIFLSFPVSNAYCITTKIRVAGISNESVIIQWSIRGAKSRALRRAQLEIQNENVLTDHFDLAAIVISPRGRGTAMIPLKDPTSLRAKLVLRSNKISISNVITVYQDEDPNDGDLIDDDIPLIDPNNDPEIPSVEYSLEVKDGRTFCDRAVVADTLRRLNIARAAAGLPTLIEDSILSRAALAHANWMATKNSMSHEGWFDRYILSGGALGAVAQNIAMVARNAAQLAEGWLASASHRENILNPKYKRTGIECVAARDGTYFWSHYFGS